MKNNIKIALWFLILLIALSPIVVLGWGIWRAGALQ